MPITSNHQSPIGKPASKEDFNKEYYEELKKHIRRTLLESGFPEYLKEKKAGWIVTPLQQGLAARVAHRRLYGDGIPDMARGTLVLAALRGYITALIEKGYSVTPIVNDRALSFFDFSNLNPRVLSEVHPYLLVISPKSVKIGR